jgi:hypothetical protein
VDKYHIFLIHSLVVGHLGYFHSLAIVNSTVINILPDFLNEINLTNPCIQTVYKTGAIYLVILTTKLFGSILDNRRKSTSFRVATACLLIGKQQ